MSANSSRMQKSLWRALLNREGAAGDLRDYYEQAVHSLEERLRAAGEIPVTPTLVHAICSACPNAFTQGCLLPRGWGL